MEMRFAEFVDPLFFKAVGQSDASLESSAGDGSFLVL
jgi:hypothetical protein